MSKKIEDFIYNNKNVFDDYTPSEAIWQRIEKKLEQPENKRKGKIVLIRKWTSVAAAVAISFMITAIVMQWNREKNTLQNTANIGPNTEENNTLDTPDNKQLAVNNDTPYTTYNVPVSVSSKKGKENDRALNPDEEELYHYSRLIEIKQSQMQALKKSEPELYKAFSKDMEMLETSYDALKAQLTHGVNTEKLLEAMIGNLKMQSALLNKQLDILKQVHHKKEKNDPQYKNL